MLVRILNPVSNIKYQGPKTIEIAGGFGYIQPDIAFFNKKNMNFKEEQF